MKERKKPQRGCWGQGNQKVKSNSIENYNTCKTPIYRCDGKLIGVIMDNIFFRNMKGSIHLLRHPPSWAIDSSVFEKLEKLGVRYIENKDVELNIVYRCDLEVFKQNVFKLNRGHGDQMALQLKYWEIIQPGNEQSEQLRIVGEAS